MAAMVTEIEMKASGSRVEGTGTEDAAEVGGPRHRRAGDLRLFAPLRRPESETTVQKLATTHTATGAGRGKAYPGRTYLETIKKN